MKHKPLKPCPKCHNKTIWIWNVCGTRKYFCVCTQCNFTGKTRHFLRRAVRAWNKQKKVK